MSTKEVKAPAKNTARKSPAKKAEIVKVEEEKLNPVLSMLQLAMTDSNVDLEKMDKIMQMAERHESKLAEKSFHSAMAILQGEIPTIAKDGIIPDKAGKVRSKFSKYETIMAAIGPVLAKHGFAVSFRPKVADGKLIVDCVVSHKDGHTQETSLELPHDNSGQKNSVQAIGSSMSYAKRYTLCLMFNIPTGGEDNDGNEVIPEQAEPRTLKELTKMFDNVTNMEELKVLWESLSSAERKIANDLKDATKTNFS